MTVTAPDKWSIISFRNLSRSQPLGGPSKRRKIQRPWARSQCASWLRWLCNLEDFVELFHFSSSWTCQKILYLAAALFLHSNFVLLLNMLSCKNILSNSQFCKDYSKDMVTKACCIFCTTSVTTRLASMLYTIALNRNKIRLCCAPYNQNKDVFHNY